jgi:hypothetical protein
VYYSPEPGEPKTAILTNCTVAYNVAEVGSQLYVVVFGDTNGLLMANTLIVGAPGGDPNCPVGVPGGIAMVSIGGNISSDASFCNLDEARGDQIGVANTGLAAALADNGGATQTLSIPESSPAFGAGLPLNCPATDQRGVGRPLPCAVGAFEPGEIAPIACGEASEIAGALRTGSPSAAAITATDALIVLRAAVGAFQCPACICDVNSAGGVSATDALILLRVAVGQPLSLDCPPCT